MSDNVIMLKVFVDRITQTDEAFKRMDETKTRASGEEQKKKFEANMVWTRSFSVGERERE